MNFYCLEFLKEDKETMCKFMCWADSEADAIKRFSLTTGYLMENIKKVTLIKELKQNGID